METFTQKSIQRQKDSALCWGGRAGWPFSPDSVQHQEICQRNCSWGGRTIIKRATNPQVLSNVPELSCRSTWDLDAVTLLCPLGFCQCPAKDEANVTHLPSGLACKRSFQLIWLELWIWLFLMPLTLTSFGEIKASHAECITCSSRINLVQWVGLYSPLPPCTPLHLLWGILHWSLWSEMTELNFTSFKRNFRNAGPFLSSFVHDCVKIFGSHSVQHWCLSVLNWILDKLAYPDIKSKR